MNAIIAKAISKTENKWTLGFPVVKASGETVIFNPDNDSQTPVYPDTVCYSLLECDKNGRELFIGDIINDFGGGTPVVDKKHPDYDPAMAFPPVKYLGDITNLGTIILIDGTIRIETATLSYAYNISHGSPLSKMEYHSNQYDHLIK